MTPDFQLPLLTLSQCSLAPCSMEYTSCCSCSRAGALVRTPKTILLKGMEERVALNAKTSDDPPRWHCLKFR